MRTRRGTPSIEENLKLAIDMVSGLFGRLPLVPAAERAALRALQERLSDLQERKEPPERGASAGPDEASGTDGGPVAVLARLLERSVSQNPDDSRREFVQRVLDEIGPDEARLLSALSDGATYPLIQVGYGSRLGGQTHDYLDNVSSIGRTAGVSWPEAVPAYLSHLLALGLVERGPEDPSLKQQYEILETDVVIRDAVRTLEERKQTPRLLRRTVRLSDLGHQFWITCQPES